MRQLFWSLPLLWMACGHTTLVTVSPDALELNAEVVQATKHPVAEVTLRNVSAERVAVTETFGFRPHSWLGLFIEDQDGRKVPYPTTIPDLVLELPDYLCLKPGETLSWTIDLMDWDVIFGGDIWERSLSFELQPGKYRLRTLYTDGPSRGRHEVRAGCPPISGSVSSEWISFTVERPD